MLSKSSRKESSTLALLMQYLPAKRFIVLNNLFDLLLSEKIINISRTRILKLNFEKPTVATGRLLMLTYSAGAKFLLQLDY